MWTDPTDWATRDLFYGPGGKEHEPQGPFTFVKEDLDGTNAKFTVQAGDGTKWKVKLGLEARPETAATRLVWAAGYYADEDYFLRDLKVDGLPHHLHRGQNLIEAGGTVHNVRLKREHESGKKTGTWKWNDSAIEGSQEWNGLRVLMSVLNNWDLKDENNAVFERGSNRVYLVSDLGASLGSGNRTLPKDRSKDNIDSYRRAKFIRAVHGNQLDFNSPGAPAFIFIFTPKEYFSRLRMEKLGRRVPRADAKWVGHLLARLSDQQLRDAFRAAGYNAQEVDLLAQVLRARIAALTDL